MRIRMHRGGLDEAMKTIEEIPATLKDVKAYLVKHVGLRATIAAIEVKPYTALPDKRIGWDQTYLVVLGNHPVAFSDGPVET